MDEAAPPEAIPTGVDKRFREEALRNRLAQRPASQLRTLSSWPQWSAWTLLVVAIGGAITAARAHFGQVAVGEAWAHGDDGCVVAFFPERYRPRLHPGMRLRLAPPARGEAFTIAFIAPAPLAAASVSQRYGALASSDGAFTEVRSTCPDTALERYASRRIGFVEATVATRTLLDGWRATGSGQ